MTMWINLEHIFAKHWTITGHTFIIVLAFAVAPCHSCRAYCAIICFPRIFSGTSSRHNAVSSINVMIIIVNNSKSFNTLPYKV